MNGGKVEGRYIRAGTTDPFEVATLLFADQALEVAGDALDNKVRVDVVMTGMAVALVRIAEKCDQKEVCAEMLEHYVVDLRSGLPIFDDAGGGRA